MNSIPFDRRAHPPGATFSIWHAKDGWSIRRIDWPQPKGAPVRGSLIFAGGRGDFIEKYLEALAHWHGRGWNVTSFDWRSQGESRGSIEGGHLDSFEPLVEDGAALLRDWLSSSSGPHVAIGHSMGGHLLLRILAEQHPLLDAAVLVAPMIGINSGPMPVWAAQPVAQTFSALGWGRQPVWKGSGGKELPGSFRQSILTSCDERFADELWWFEQKPGFSLGAPSWGWLSAAYESISKLTTDKLKNVTMPVLLVGTDQDRLVSPAAIRWAAEQLPRAELMMFKDAAHELLRESDRVRLQALDRIDHFLEERARA